MEAASACHCKVYALAAYLLTHLFMFHFSFAGVLNHFPIAARKNYNEVIFYKEYLSLKVKSLRSIVCLTLSCLPANAEKNPIPQYFWNETYPKSLQRSSPLTTFQYTDFQQIGFFYYLYQWSSIIEKAPGALSVEPSLTNRKSP